MSLHPQRFSISRVRELAQAAGAKIGTRYRYESLRIDGMDCTTCATVIEHALQRMEVVLDASVSYAAERLRLEFDSEKSSAKLSSCAFRPWVMPCWKKATRPDGSPNIGS